MSFKRFSQLAVQLGKTLFYRWAEKIKTAWCVFDIPANGWEDVGEVRTRGSGGVLRWRRWRNKDAWRRDKFTVYGIFAAVCIDVYASIFYSRRVWPVEWLEGTGSLLEGLWRCCSDRIKITTVKHKLMVQWMRTVNVSHGCRKICEAAQAHHQQCTVFYFRHHVCVNIFKRGNSYPFYIMNAIMNRESDRDICIDVLPSKIRIIADENAHKWDWSLSMLVKRSLHV